MRLTDLFPFLRSESPPPTATISTSTPPKYTPSPAAATASASASGATPLPKPNPTDPEKKRITMLEATKALLNRIDGNGNKLANKLINGTITDQELIALTQATTFTSKSVMASEEYWTYDENCYNKTQAIFDFVKTVGPALSEKNLFRYSSFLIKQEMLKEVEAFRNTSLGSMFLLYETGRHANKVLLENVNDTTLFPLTFIFHLNTEILPFLEKDTQKEGKKLLNDADKAQFVCFNLIGDAPRLKCDQLFHAKISSYCEKTSRDLQQICWLAMPKNLNNITVDQIKLSDSIDLEYRRILDAALTPLSLSSSGFFYEPPLTISSPSPTLKSSNSFIQRPVDDDSTFGLYALQLLTKLITTYLKEEGKEHTDKIKLNMLHEVHTAIHQCIGCKALFDNRAFVEALKLAEKFYLPYTDINRHSGEIIKAARMGLVLSGLQIKMNTRPRPIRPPSSGPQSNIPKM